MRSSYFLNNEALHAIIIPLSHHASLGIHFNRNFIGTVFILVFTLAAESDLASEEAETRRGPLSPAMSDDVDLLLLLTEWTGPLCDLPGFDDPKSGWKPPSPFP